MKGNKIRSLRFKAERGEIVWRNRPSTVAGMRERGNECAIALRSLGRHGARQVGVRTSAPGTISTSRRGRRTRGRMGEAARATSGSSASRRSSGADDGIVGGNEVSGEMSGAFVIGMEGRQAGRRVVGGQGSAEQVRSGARGKVTAEASSPQHQNR